MRPAIALLLAATVALAQQHVFSDDEYEDDFADVAKKWSAIKRAGRPTSVVYPPATLTETFDPTSAFPTPTGFAGPAALGDESMAAAQEDYPPPLRAPGVAPVRVRDAKVRLPHFDRARASDAGLQKKFDAPAAWGNLSPYNALASTGASPRIPGGCELQQLHVLHRHGVRYPEEDDPPFEFAHRLSKVVKKGTGFTARGELAFLNGWRYRLGSETLAPLGRAQMFNLGVSLRYALFRLRAARRLTPIQDEVRRDPQAVHRRGPPACLPHH